MVRSQGMMGRRIAELIRTLPHTYVYKVLRINSLGLDFVRSC